MEARARAAIAKLQELQQQGAPAAAGHGADDPDGAPVGAMPDEAETISRALLLAQRTADVTVAEAQAEAEALTSARAAGGRAARRRGARGGSGDGRRGARRGAPGQGGRADRGGGRGAVAARPPRLPPRRRRDPRGPRRRPARAAARRRSARCRTWSIARPTVSARCACRRAVGAARTTPRRTIERGRDGRARRRRPSGLPVGANSGADPRRSADVTWRASASTRPSPPSLRKNGGRPAACRLSRTERVQPVIAGASEWLGRRGGGQAGWYRGLRLVPGRADPAARTDR